MREIRIAAIIVPLLLMVGVSHACCKGCAPQEEPEEPTEEVEEEEEEPLGAVLGNVLPDTDVVNHASRDQPLTQLRQEEYLFDGDELNVTQGGVALVSLEIGWEFFLFNNTHLGMELREGETIEETMLMESGTLLGRRRLERSEGKPVIFPLPGDRSITVTGTTFFIVLDSDTEQAIVGNFDGAVDLVGGGVSLSLPAGEYIRDWEPDQPPDEALQEPITFSPENFESWGRELSAPGDVMEEVCLDDSQFVEDVTIPDGTELLPDEPFTKTWQLRNTGSCTWTPGYSLVFLTGDRLSGLEEVALDAPVEPGDTVEISVRMTAPQEPGGYVSSWQMVNEERESFGQTPFVNIVVGEPPDTTPPLSPVQLSPEDGESFGDYPNCPTVQLAWSEPDDPSGIDGYHIQIWVLEDGSWVVEEERFVTSDSYLFEPTGCDTSGTEYSWRVAAYDGEGNVSDYSSFSNFTVYRNIG